MLKNYKGLTEQMFEKDFRNMLYGIYNFAEEERYIYNLRQNGYDCDVDSLEFMILEGDDITLDDIKNLKHYIESEIQHDKVVVGILAFKAKKGVVPVVIKPKNVKIEEILKIE